MSQRETKSAKAPQHSQRITPHPPSESPLLFVLTGLISKLQAALHWLSVIR